MASIGFDFIGRTQNVEASYKSANTRLMIETKCNSIAYARLRYVYVIRTEMVGGFEYSR
jgi:hypothetical protein